MRGVACVLAASMLTAFFGPGRGAAQTPFEVGVGVSHFPSYVYDDRETQEWGVDVAAHLGSKSGRGLEVGYTYVPQATTTGHSAPRLHAFRLLVMSTMAIGHESQLVLRGGVGAAALVMKPQRIDCGDFPLCSEWAPRSGTRMAPVAEGGAVLRALGWLSPFVNARVYRPVGEEWSFNGDPDWITQLSAGVRLHLGGKSAGQAP